MERPLRMFEMRGGIEEAACKMSTKDLEATEITQRIKDSLEELDGVYPIPNHPPMMTHENAAAFNNLGSSTSPSQGPSWKRRRSRRWSGGQRSWLAFGGSTPVRCRFWIWC
ncbi:unnamed protein product [Urochloa humidicola]